MKPQSLVLDQKVALLDSSILDDIVDPSNPLNLGKKGSFIRKDESICNYYVIDTTTMFENPLTWHHRRVHEMCQAARFKGYHYLVIVNC